LKISYRMEHFNFFIKHRLTCQTVAWTRRNKRSCENPSF
jgi:hypothetical protein